MKKNLLYMISAVVAMMTTGCIEESPADGVGIDPTLVNVDADVTFDLAWKESSEPVECTRAAAEGYEPRFVVEAYRQGESTPVLREVLLPGGDYADGTFTLPVSLKLHALRYTFAVWADYVKTDAEGADLYYDTSNFAGISCTDPYTGSTDMRAAYYGTAAVDLTQYRDDWNVHDTLHLAMQRPQARFRVIATDVKQFKVKREADSRAAESVAGENYRACFSYNYFVPTSFSVLTGKPVDSGTGIGFTSDVALPTGGEAEMLLGSDYIFVNGTETSVVLNVEIKDGDGRTVSRTKDIRIPCRRGYVTTVRGDFFTATSQSGITVDTEFEGDIDIWI